MVSIEPLSNRARDKGWIPLREHSQWYAPEPDQRRPRRVDAIRWIREPFGRLLRRGF